jgi:predicted component of type VI protein secretion system
MISLEGNTRVSTRKTWGSIRKTWRLASFGVIALMGLVLLSGCGQRAIKINLDRPAELSQPAWVGVYFLSQETALNELGNDQLADPDGVDRGAGVVDKEVFPVYPGDAAHQINMKDYDPEIRWVVVAAGFPDARRCARQRIPVREGASLKIRVIVDEDCIFLDLD